MDMHATMIGAPVPQIQGPDKVTGRMRFAADVELPGMLWGKILRSPYPHARIRRIDASAAWRVPGVKAVVTGQDVPGHLMGKVLRDMPVLCWDRVRYIGDRVAAVAAETPDAVGCQLFELPITAERVYAALQASGSTATTTSPH
jgi:CO/xanthine dehydrogenase Mo-binding subunit